MVMPWLRWALLMVLPCSGDESHELQCLHLDHYPGNCPVNIMKGACYSSQAGANWACLPDGVSSGGNCGSIQLPSQDGFYKGYCSFFEKPTTPTTTTTTTPCNVRRLRIVNRCMSEPIWIAHEATRGQIGPGIQNFLIPPDDFHDFCTPDKLTGTRYWPKMLCDDDGLHCLLGSSGGPGEGCSEAGQYGQCAPPIDTKFEATFGTRGQPCSGVSSKDCDFIDVSLVDGWTLPFRLSISGECSGPNNMHPSEIDCSGLTFEQCPTDEVLGQHKYNMQAHYRGYGSVAGCYSPCLKLTDPKWNNTASGHSRSDDVAAPYCCPTPPVSPKGCRSGPVAQTKYVQAVHTYCPGVYAYCYDDAMGLLQCSADSYYQLEFFCPSTLPSWSYKMVTTTRISRTSTGTSTFHTVTSVTATSQTFTSTLTTWTSTSVTETSTSLNETAEEGAQRLRSQAGWRALPDSAEAFYPIAGCGLIVVGLLAVCICASSDRGQETRRDPLLQDEAQE